MNDTREREYVSEHVRDRRRSCGAVGLVVRCCSCRRQSPARSAGHSGQIALSQWTGAGPELRINVEVCAVQEAGARPRKLFGSAHLVRFAFVCDWLLGLDVDQNEATDFSAASRPCRKDLGFIVASIFLHLGETLLLGFNYDRTLTFWFVLR